MREDANEESVRKALSPVKPKPHKNVKGDGKGNKAHVAKDEKATDADKSETAMPGPIKTPKPKVKAKSKGDGKGKEGRPQPKADPKPKAKAPVLHQIPRQSQRLHRKQR